MQPDTILENVVRTLGVSKSEFLDRESEDPAVRLALGETKVIAETKEALTKLHVKNVAFEATKKELKQLFSPFGQTPMSVTNVDDLRLPKKNIGQYGGFAFVEFVTKQEASNAKNALSSTHFYGRHLVLEWANDDNTMEAICARPDAKYMDQENDNPKKRKSSTVLNESRMKFERIAE